MGVELLSVHVPKTAGNSVRRVLVRRYGARVVRLYHDFRDAVSYERALARRPDARAVHGHARLDPLRDAFPDARTLMWFRHPVDRLLSYHAYWLSLRPHGNPNHDRFLNGDRSPQALAALLHDEVAGYLGGTDVEALDFVGLVEASGEDLPRLERWLEAEGLGRDMPTGPRDALARTVARLDAWRAPRANRGRRSREGGDPNVRREVADILADEMTIYERARARRAAEARSEPSSRRNSTSRA